MLCLHLQRLEIQIGLMYLKYGDSRLTRNFSNYEDSPEISSHFEYLENRLRGLDVTWQSVGGDLTVHP
jgi:hypothetical protein